MVEFSKPKVYRELFTPAKVIYLYIFYYLYMFYYLNFSINILVKPT